MNELRLLAPPEVGQATRRFHLAWIGAWIQNMPADVDERWFSHEWFVAWNAAMSESVTPRAMRIGGFDINQLTISGNLTRDPDLRTLPSGQTVCNIRIANDERRKTSAGEWTDHPQYFDVAIWSGLGEWVAHNLTQGAQVVIGGRLRLRQYTTSDGAQRQAVDITADRIVPMRRTRVEPTPEEVESGRDDLADDIPF